MTGTLIARGGSEGRHHHTLPTSRANSDVPHFNATESLKCLRESWNISQDSGEFFKNIAPPNCTTDEPKKLQTFFLRSVDVWNGKKPS